jgi:hypothetical protein
MKKVNLIAVFVFVALAAIAQPEHGHPHHGKGDMKAQNPELNQALQQYLEKEVFPVLITKKAEFDESLSRKQRKELDKLRQKGKTLKAEVKAFYEKAKADYDAEKDKSAVHETYGKEMRVQKIAQMKFHDEVMTWIEANDKEVKAAMEDLKPMHEKWQTEKKAILEANRPESVEKPNFEKELKGEHHGKKGDKYHGYHKGKYGYHKEMAAVKFVLWDYELPEAMAATEKTATKETPLKSLNLSAYPNPANSTTTVKFELPNDVKLVTLIITSSNGETVKQLIYNDLLKGKQTIQVDISNLQTGQYFYTIVADGLKKTEKLVVE